MFASLSLFSEAFDTGRWCSGNCSDYVFTQAELTIEFVAFFFSFIPYLLLWLFFLYIIQLLNIYYLFIWIFNLVFTDFFFEKNMLIYLLFFLFSIFDILILEQFFKFFFGATSAVWDLFFVLLNGKKNVLLFFSLLYIYKFKNEKL